MEKRYFNRGSCIIMDKGRADVAHASASLRTQLEFQEPRIAPGFTAKRTQAPGLNPRAKRTQQPADSKAHRSLTTQFSTAAGNSATTGVSAGAAIYSFPFVFALPFGDSLVAVRDPLFSSFCSIGIWT
jgi:hypothetical protein